MPTIRVKENEPFETALRRFKRTIEKSGLLTELRAREFYEKPTAERKRKKAAAIKRHYKRLRSQMLPKKLLNFSTLPNKAFIKELKWQLSETESEIFRTPFKLTAKSAAIRLFANLSDTASAAAFMKIRKYRISARLVMDPGW